MSTTSKKIKVFTDEFGDKYVEVPVTVKVKLYLPEDLNPVGLTHNDVRLLSRDLERNDLGDLVLGELDTKNVVMED